MSEPQISLSNELRVLFQALIGARLSVERVIDTADDDREIAHGIISQLVLITDRVRLLDRAVRGVVDPALLLNPQNQALSPKSGDEDDLLLSPWDDERLVRHYRIELRREKRRRESASQ